MARTPLRADPLHPRGPGGAVPRGAIPPLSKPEKQRNSLLGPAQQERLKTSLPAQLKNNSLILTASHKNILSPRYS